MDDNDGFSENLKGKNKKKVVARGAAKKRRRRKKLYSFRTSVHVIIPDYVNCLALFVDIHVTIPVPYT